MCNLQNVGQLQHDNKKSPETIIVWELIYRNLKVLPKSINYANNISFIRFTIKVMRKLLQKYIIFICQRLDKNILMFKTTSLQFVIRERKNENVSKFNARHIFFFIIKISLRLSNVEFYEQNREILRHNRTSCEEQN